MATSYDAVVIGSGPNGLAAAITLARAKKSVLILESQPTIGGGMRTTALTLPGFLHDVCSAVHPLAISSPFFRNLPLDIEWIQPTAPLAHPFDDGSLVMLERSLENTADHLGVDGKAYHRLMQPLITNWDDLAPDILGPLKFPKHPLMMAQFALHGLQSASGLAKRLFKAEKTQSLFAGLAAHSILPLTSCATAAFGLILGVLGHKVGWPIPKGGSQKIADALGKYFISLGGEIQTNTKVNRLEDLPTSRFIFFDLSPKEIIRIAGHTFSQHYIDELKKYRNGPGVFKMDWALSHPIPWKAKEALTAGTVHLGGTLQEITQSEKDVWEGKIADKNFIILAQPSLFDPTRAPKGKHTAWAYCHVPNGSTIDMSANIETQIEKLAPGFKDCILGRHTMNCVQLESYNSNYVGGDINGGAADIFQLFARPTLSLVPYATPNPEIFICSSSTPPGGGVHGMCGYHAANAALKSLM